MNNQIQNTPNTMQQAPYQPPQMNYVPPSPLQNGTGNYPYTPPAFAPPPAKRSFYQRLTDSFAENFGLSQKSASAVLLTDLILFGASMLVITYPLVLLAAATLAYIVYNWEVHEFQQDRNKVRPTTALVFLFTAIPVPLCSIFALFYGLKKK